MTLRVTVSRLLGGALLVVCFGAILWRLPLLRSLDLFRIERVEVSGVQLLAPHEVLAASGVRLGQNVWDDPEPWLAALRAHPVVGDASIERSLPRTLLIRVEERRPVALIEAGALLPVTADGEILPVDPTRAPVDLPLVRIAVTAADMRVEDPHARRLLAEIGRLGELDPALLARVSEIRSASAGDLRLTLSQPAAEVLLPPVTEVERLRQLRAVLYDIERRLASGGRDRSEPRTVRVDARFADQVVVRLPQSS